MSDEPDMRRRSEVLATAIENYLDGLGFEGVLGDWMVVGSVVRVEANGEPDAAYFTALRGGSMLQHHALGLLAKAEDALIAGEEE